MAYTHITYVHKTTTMQYTYSYNDILVNSHVIQVQVYKKKINNHDLKTKEK